jgi:hypothetical protein
VGARRTYHVRIRKNVGKSFLVLSKKGGGRDFPTPYITLSVAKPVPYTAEYELIHES